MKNKPSSFLSTDTPFVIPFNHFISAFVVNLVGLHLLDKKILLTDQQPEHTGVIQNRLICFPDTAGA